MARRMRAIDWSGEPLGALGAPAGWPQNRRTALGICLSSRSPLHVWWGPGLTPFYNDDYIPVVGRRHPSALGIPAAQVWHEISELAGPPAIVKAAEALRG
jgi:hypothetical protein